MATQFQISDSSNKPRYLQIKDHIISMVRSGQLSPGDTLPSESEFCASLGISRTTVRQAMEELVSEGYLIRRRGLGTFVAPKTLPRKINRMYNFTEDMLEMGLTPSSRVLQCEVVAATEDLRKKLCLDVGETVFQLKRIRYANGEPILLETTCIPYRLCAGIEKYDFSDRSLYQTLKEEYGLAFFKAVETYRCVTVSSHSAELLDMGSSNHVAFEISRNGFLKDGTPFEYTVSHTRSDKCYLQVELYS